MRTSKPDKRGHIGKRIGDELRGKFWAAAETVEIPRGARKKIGPILREAREGGIAVFRGKHELRPHKEVLVGEERLNSFKKRNVV